MRNRCTIAWAPLPLLLSVAGCAAHAPLTTAKTTEGATAASPPGARSSVAAPWRVSCTGKGTPLAGWEVLQDRSSPGPGPVLALTATNHTSTSAFNLCIDEAQRFKDGTFTVHSRANGGMVDQGGGPIWRVQDANNYYLCRANPLEENLRLYVVTGGVRRQLATVDAKHSTGMWHSLEVTQAGKKIVCVLDGHTKVEATDATISAEGAVGVWTKADARTSFVVPWPVESAPAR